MEANRLSTKDLMVGDWVMINPISYYQVGQIRMEFDELRICLKGTEVFATENDIMPVPLTQEILEKNGFEYKEKELGLYGVTTAPHYLRDDVPFEVFCDGEPFAIWFKDPINIKYVHQLQNALRLCGIEEEITL